MGQGLDVIIVEEDPAVCDMLSENISRFFTWGDIVTFTDAAAAARYCLKRDTGIAIFIVDIFLGGESGFSFLDEVAPQYPLLYGDTIMLAGSASDEIVDMCLASDINYLLEKPIRPYALQMAVSAIAWKYVKFTQRLMENPEFLRTCKGLVC